MERLTVKCDDGHWGLSFTVYDKAIPSRILEKLPIAIDRLAAYENTGLTPEEVSKMAREWTAYETTLSYVDEIGGYARLLELAQAEKERRLVVLPCSLHQPLYILKNGEIYRNYGCQWHFTGEENQTFGTLSMYGEFVRLDDFGKTVFLTREEAEAALKRGRR